nr:MAG TPA: transmembrane protein [Bacteriophage sp.]
MFIQFSVSKLIIIIYVVKTISFSKSTYVTCIVYITYCLI